jgi:serine/threonine protein kinase
VATDFHLRVQRVLDQVLARPPAAREEALRQLCGPDERLRTEALSLLPHYADLQAYEPPPPAGTGWKLPGTTTFLQARAEAEVVHEDPDPKPPFSVDQYTVVQVLGRGGMGVVYRAIHPTLHRVVAMKILRRKLSTAQDRWRFMYEEEILRQLRHPGIARFSHSGLARLRFRSPGGYECDERPYFVMEYVEGEPLVQYAATQALSGRQRLALLVKICAAVEYAHQRGIVHCDLKPDNILVDGAGQPKVLDFGIARLAADEAARNRELRVGGTLPYASPEQLQGRVDRLTPASDVYALALIAHELLTGERPRRSGDVVHLSLGTVRLDTVADPRATEALDREVTYYISAILATALRQTRGDPYRSAGELGRDLEEVLGHYPAESRWAAFKQRLTSGLGAGAGKWATSPLSRPLSAVLRKRIGMNVEQRSRRDTERPK